MKKILLQRGFTLIELLVVIAIIGILTAIVTANFTTAKSRSRDAKRVSDLAQIQLALDQAFDKCSVYPPASSAKLVETTVVCSINSTDFPVSYFISRVPKEDATNSYYYYTPTGGLDYILRARLENNNSVLIDDIDNADITSSDIKTAVTGGSVGGCDDAASPFYYCVQPK
jgi:prepilin-type N-terminal cleavage/methylation domain-containing protein